MRLALVAYGAAFTNLLILSRIYFSALAQLKTVNDAQYSLEFNSDASKNQPDSKLSQLNKLPFDKFLNQATQSLISHSKYKENFIKNTKKIKKLQLKAYKLFLRLNNKTRPAREMAQRLAVFVKRREEIEHLNEAYRKGQQTFYLHENTFLDWFDNELKQLSGTVPPRSVEELLPEEKQLLFGRDANLNKTDSLEINRASSGPNYNNINQEIPATRSHKRSVRSADSGTDDNDPDELPAKVDWRTSGCISKPINQSNCGACYAIATIGALEAERCLSKQSKSALLSSQQIIDCSSGGDNKNDVVSEFYNYGCNGGWPTRVLNYLQEVGRVAREVCYPFVGENTGHTTGQQQQQQSSGIRRKCKLRQANKRSPGCILAASVKLDKPRKGAKLKYEILNNEKDILYHVAKTGPVVTVLKATNNFIYYSGGVFDDASCTRYPDDVDHAVLIVGYGQEKGLDYWLIKNSWGTDTWGIDGYGKVKRGINACSIGHWGWVILG